MSTTTTIRIEAELKARLAAVAERAGKTPHAFIVEALARTVEQAEEDDAFIQLADCRWAKLVESGRSMGLDDAADYLRARARGERPRRPRARKPG